MKPIRLFLALLAVCVACVAVGGCAAWVYMGWVGQEVVNEEARHAPCRGYQTMDVLCPDAKPDFDFKGTTAQ